MKSIGVIFKDWEVRAFREGRKTQFRRVVKPQPYECDGEFVTHFEDAVGDPILVGDPRFISKCPFGQPGDEIWVKETWVELLHTSPATGEPLLCDGDKLIEHATRGVDGRWNYNGRVIAYRATSEVEFCDGDGFTSPHFANKDDMPKWRPSIHMPIWASRLTLQIEAVRAERVQDISDRDAMDEGYDGTADQQPDYEPRIWFRDIWNSIHVPGSWDANPWVWVGTVRAKK